MPNATRNTAGTGSSGGVAIEMPRLSNDDGAAILSSWLVAVGDVVEKGAIVAELETDKATVELEAPVDGRIEALIVRAGTEGLKPGVVLGRIAPAASAGGGGELPISDSPAPSGAASSSDSNSLARSAATPLARRVAAERGIALEGVVGTGLGGRIEKADIERAVAAPRSEESAEVAPVERSAPSARAVASGPAAVTAAKTAAKTAATTAAMTAPLGGPRPSVALALHCLADALVAARARLGGTSESGPGAAGASKLSLNDLILRAAALALRDVPAANRRRGASGIEVVEAVDLGLVVATEQGPRIVVVRDADRKGLTTLSGELRSRIGAARGGEPSDSPEGAVSLLVTSFARFGIEAAHPMVPEDQIGVLAVGALREEPIVENGAIRAAHRLSLTLAFDPNAVGGGVMAELLSALRRRLEDPLGWLL